MTFDNILFPIDFSDSCNGVKADVEWLAKKFNSKVTLLYVFEVPPAWCGMGDAYAVSTEWLTQIMADAKKRLDTFTINLPVGQVERVLLEGRPATEIYHWCDKHHPDLIAMATHGHGALEGLMMGSVTAKVLHNVNVPLWLRPLDAEKAAAKTGSATTKFQIICGIGLAEETESVLKYAKHLAQAFDANVTLVHSVPEEETIPNKYLDFDLHNVLKGIAATEIATHQRRAGTDFPAVITNTAIGTSLVDVAAEKKADMILIGRGHSRKFLGRFRTHALDLLSLSHCPVFSYCPEESYIVSEPQLITATA
jgi:nucleotide-binding universal stress UspA family protein